VRLKGLTVRPKTLLNVSGHLYPIAYDQIYLTGNSDEGIPLESVELDIVFNIFVSVVAPHALTVGFDKGNSSKGLQDVNQNCVFLCVGIDPGNVALGIQVVNIHRQTKRLQTDPCTIRCL